VLEIEDPGDDPEKEVKIDEQRRWHAARPRAHVPDQLASSSMALCDGDSGADAGDSKIPTACTLFVSPRLLHSAFLPTSPTRTRRCADLRRPGDSMGRRWRQPAAHQGV
ncbi:unnamed protein product, partial [Urochloa humidicola]